MPNTLISMVKCLCMGFFLCLCGLAMGCKHGAKAPVLPERAPILCSSEAAAALVLPEQVRMPSGAVLAMPSTAPERFILVQEMLREYEDTPPVWCFDVLEHDAMGGSVQNAERGSVQNAERGSVQNAERGSVQNAQNPPTAKIAPEQPRMDSTGYAPAQDLLARLLLEGHGVEQNSARAFGFALDAARQGHVQAQLLVATLYTLGHGVARDAEQAFAWLKEAARAEEPEAMAMLADAYRQGIGVMKDEEEAFLWTLKAAKQGVERARLWLGLHYFYGIGNAKDHGEALALLRPFADAGDGEAALCVGVIYYQGIGITQDFTMATQYFRQGAMEGEPRCMSLLASMLELGEGGPVDKVAAYAWYGMAQEHGDRASLPFLQKLEQTMQAEELVAGRALLLRLQGELARADSEGR